MYSRPCRENTGEKHNTLVNIYMYLFFEKVAKWKYLRIKVTGKIAPVLN
jgi:hypothetical protein